MESDAADRLRGGWLKLLQTDLASLSPTAVNQLVGWTLNGRMELSEPINGRRQLNASEIPDDVWRKIAGELKPRWEQAPQRDDKHLLGEALRSIYASRFDSTELLRFLRNRIESAPPEYRLIYVQSLFDTLLATCWTEEIERVAFARWRDLSDAKELGDRMFVQVPALYRLVDAILANRQAQANKRLSDQGGLDKLTRRELSAKKAELLKAAQTGLAERLAEHTSITARRIRNRDWIGQAKRLAMS